MVDELKRGRGRPGAAREAINERTKANILDVATCEFAEKGLSGARVDEIADKTQSSKRMIYYHFGSKEGLYRQVLERAYGNFRNIETDMRLDDLPPAEALRRICEFTFDYHNAHPEFVRLVMNENIMHGETIGHLESVKTRNRAIIRNLGSLIERGVADGSFRAGIDPINLHMSISALCFYNVSNRHTFSRIFAWDMTSPETLAERRAIIADTMIRWCLRDTAADSGPDGTLALKGD